MDEQFCKDAVDAIHNTSKAIMILSDRLGQTDIADLAEKTLNIFHEAIKSYHKRLEQSHDH